MTKELNNEALEAAVAVGVEQFDQQMQLGGGNLNDMFTRVIQAYVDVVDSQKEV